MHSADGVACLVEFEIGIFRCFTMELTSGLGHRLLTGVMPCLPYAALHESQMTQPHGRTRLPSRQASGSIPAAAKSALY